MHWQDVAKAAAKELKIRLVDQAAMDDSVHPFEEWGLPIWRQPGDAGRRLINGGRPVRSGKWQIMNNGESCKWIVAEAAGNVLGSERIQERIQERIFIVRLLNDKLDPGHIAGAVGFSTREHKVHVYRFKACLLVCGGLFTAGDGVGASGHKFYPGSHAEGRIAAKSMVK